MPDIRKLIQTGANRDTMRTAFPILNMVIDSANESLNTANESLSAANEAKTDASSAIQTANEANTKSDDTQQQLNNIVINNGESDAEVLQARGTYSLLNERLEATDVQLADTVRVINVKAHGAVGDGVADDWQAIQAAITLAETTNRAVFLPSGTYYVSQTLRTQHMYTYNYTKGIRIYGNGKDSVLMGAREMVAADYNQELSEQALLAIHGSNNIIENIAFEGGKVALFLGQDPRTTEYSSASMNVLNKLWFYYNGTSIILKHGEGNHYNKFRDMHIAHAQIGIHLTKGIIDRVNNNRNIFENIRVSRAWIGYIIEDGDGNFFNKIYAETIRTGQTIGARPSQLPAELGDNHCAIIVTSGQYNFFDNFSSEAVDWDIYDAGFRNDFVRGMIKDDTAEDVKVTFVNPTNSPRTYSANSWKMGGLGFQPVPNVIFPNTSGGVTVTTPIFDDNYHKQLIDLLPLCPQMVSKHSYSRAIFHRLGGFCDFHIAYRFKVAVGEESQPLKIKLPFSDKIDIERVYTRGLTGDNTMPVKVVIGRGTPYQQEVFARFSTDAEATTFGGEHIIIPAPTGTWTSDSEGSYLYAQIRYSIY
jgi:Pectate lyase superfamily protein